MVLRAWLGAALVFLVAAPAGAQNTQAAREHFEAGTHAFDRGDYELAVTEFQAAYDVFAHPSESEAMKVVLFRD